MERYTNQMKKDKHYIFGTFIIILIQNQLKPFEFSCDITTTKWNYDLWARWMSKIMKGYVREEKKVKRNGREHMASQLTPCEVFADESDSKLGFLEGTYEEQSFGYTLYFNEVWEGRCQFQTQISHHPL